MNFSNNKIIIKQFSAIVKQFHQIHKTLPIFQIEQPVISHKRNINNVLKTVTVHYKLIQTKEKLKEERQKV